MSVPFDTVSNDVFSSDEDLVNAGLSLRSSLAQTLDLGGLSKKMCPYLMGDGAVVIFLLLEYENSDQARALETLLKQKNYVLYKPSRVAVSPTLLHSLVRSQVTLIHRSTLARQHVTGQQSTVIVQAFQAIVEWAVRQNASDIHLNISKQNTVSSVYFTVQGKYLSPERFRAITTSTLVDIVAVAWMSIQGGNGAVFNPLLEQQGRLQKIVDGQPVVLRWASLATDDGCSVCLRVLPNTEAKQLVSLNDLGYLPSQIAQLDRAQTSEGGAILLSGVVGSGKSTTLASLIGSLPKHRKIITLEDPVEYRIHNALQNSIVRKLDEPDEHVFAAKLKTVKRSAMTDLLIGEIRDSETAKAFMDLVSSGTNLYSTVHAPSALLIMDRLASSFIGVPRDFLATPGLIKLLVYQALIPVLCTECAQPLASLRAGHKDALGIPRGATYWEHYVQRFSALYQLDIHKIRVSNPDGCHRCRHPEVSDFNGKLGRTVVAEMIEPNLDSNLLSLMRSGDSVALRDYFFSLPRSPLDDSDMTNKSAMEVALYKVSQGLVDPRDIELRFKSFETDEIWRRKYASRT